MNQQLKCHDHTSLIVILKRFFVISVANIASYVLEVIITVHVAPIRNMLFSYSMAKVLWEMVAVSNCTST